MEARIAHAVTHGGRPDMDDVGSDVPGDVKSLISQCWSQEPNERPSMLGKMTIMFCLCVWQTKTRCMDDTGLAILRVKHMFLKGHRFNNLIFLKNYSLYSHK